MPRVLSLIGDVLDVVLPVSSTASGARTTTQASTHATGPSATWTSPQQQQQQQQQAQQPPVYNEYGQPAAPYTYGQPPPQPYHSHQQQQQQQQQQQHMPSTPPAYGQPPPSYHQQHAQQFPPPPTSTYSAPPKPDGHQHFQDAQLPPPPLPPQSSASYHPQSQPQQYQQPYAPPPPPPPQQQPYAHGQPYESQPLSRERPALFRLLFAILWHAEFARWVTVTVSKRMPQPSDDPADCCDWTVCDACEKSLHWNLLCPCVCLGDLSMRFALASIGGVLFAAAMMLVQALHIPFDLFFLLKSVIFGSPQFGPLLKLLLLLWGVVGVAVSLPMVFIMSLFLGPVIAFGWPLSLGIRIMLESIGFALVDGVKYKAEQLRAYEREGPYMRLKLLHAILAFVFMFVGMAVCGVGFLLKTIVDAPAFVFSSLAEVWKDTCVGIAPSKERGPPGPFDDLPCCALMNCVGGAAAQLCALLMIPLRVVASVVVIAFAAVAPAIALVIGLIIGFPAGADVYFAPSSALTLLPIRQRIKSFKFFGLCVREEVSVTLSSSSSSSSSSRYRPLG